MSHTQEPWSVAEESFDNDGIQESVIRGLDGRAAIAVTLDFGPNNPGMREANAKRIVACVNYCAGIANDVLEKFEQLESDVEHCASLEKQCDEVIAQLASHHRQAAIGRAIERSCAELPEGFDLLVECENGAAGVRLYHPGGEEESEDLYCDSGLAGEIDNAINIAIAKGAAA